MPRRTQKTAKEVTATKGERAELEAFKAMPLDILVEIMSHLDTKTVLAMSRSCSSFRRILHSDDGVSVWRQARANTNGIPDLEAGALKEWEYASLIYDRSCHICQNVPTLHVDFVFKIRACSRCRRSNSKLSKLGPLITGKYHPLVWECVPMMDGAYNPEFWEPSAQKISAELYAAEKKGKAAVEAYVRLRRDINKLTRADAWAIGAWQRRVAIAAEEEDKMKERVQQIKQKLSADHGFTAAECAHRRRRVEKATNRSLRLPSSSTGWTPFTFHAYVNQPHPLTDTDWKRIRGPLVELLEAERASRLQHEVPAPPSTPVPALLTDDEDDLEVATACFHPSPVRRFSSKLFQPETQLTTGGPEMQ
ncbi:hypothetical protein JCM1840_000056 [Sporobolomyces johnsonii]